MEAIGELLFCPLVSGAERAWDLCFRPTRRETVLDVWLLRTSWMRWWLNGLAGVLSVGLLACASAGHPDVPIHQPPKRWHISPSSGARSSTLYPMVDWERVRLVRVGMCESEAERVLGARLQYYHHPVNAIVFTTHPQYGRMEVAFRLSAQKCITDVSYKERYPDRAE